MSTSPLRDSGTSSRFVLALQCMVAEAVDGGDSVSKTSLIHRSVLLGGFSMLKENISWHSPKWKVQVYVSGVGAHRGSAFDELHIELRTLGQRAGIDVSLIDTESAVTNARFCLWDEHEREIERCRKSTHGVYFITCVSR